MGKTEKLLEELTHVIEIHGNGMHYTEIHEVVRELQRYISCKALLDAIRNGK